MKRKISYMNSLFYFIVGYIIFTILFLITQIIKLNILGFNGNIAEIYVNSLSVNFVCYIIIYFIIVLLNLIYNITTTKKLNKKLKKIKERSEEHEK